MPYYLELLFLIALVMTLKALLRSQGVLVNGLSISHSRNPIGQ
jgi:hypothetical protein